MKKVSICLVDVQERGGDKAAIDLAAKIGTDAIDFDLFMHHANVEGDIYSEGVERVREHFTELKKYADEKGVVIGQTVCRGNTCLKFTLLNPLQSEAKLDELLELILSLR